MLTKVAEGVWIRRSEFCRSNTVAVAGERGVLLVDPGVSGLDMEELARDLMAAGQLVVAGFATHPHWDHVLWHSALGGPPRWASARAYEVIGATLERSRRLAAAQVVGVPLELMGQVTPLPAGAEAIVWEGPPVLLGEHDAHAPAHAYLALPEQRVLLVGDMLSDAEIPLLDPAQPGQLATYREALDRLEVAAQGMEVVIPGHGAIARGGREIAVRFAADRAYLAALARGEEPDDPRLSPDASYGGDWLPEADRSNRAQVAAER